MTFIIELEGKPVLDLLVTAIFVLFFLDLTLCLAFESRIPSANMGLQFGRCSILQEELCRILIIRLLVPITRPISFLLLFLGPQNSHFIYTVKVIDEGNGCFASSISSEIRGHVLE
jgi:hypothetical protein